MDKFGFYPFVLIQYRMNDRKYIFYNYVTEKMMGISYGTHLFITILATVYSVAIIYE